VIAILRRTRRTSPRERESSGGRSEAAIIYRMIDSSAEDNASSATRHQGSRIKAREFLGTTLATT